MARNICWGGKWGWTEPKAEPYVKFEDNLVDVDPRFAGSPPRTSASPRTRRPASLASAHPAGEDRRLQERQPGLLAP